MNHLNVYLWKEWREQRGNLALLALLLLAAVAALTALLPPETLRDPITFNGIVGLSMMATLMSVGSDLMARERQLGAMAFLERLPAGLGTAFSGKLCTFALVMAGSTLYGAALAGGATLRAHGTPSRRTLRRLAELVARDGRRALTVGLRPCRHGCRAAP